MIRCENLGRDFGNVRSVDSLTLELEKGDIFGYVGRNGAGKTTTFRMLSTLLEPSRGEAWVGGYSILTQGDEIRRILGYMPDQLGKFDGLTSQDYLELFAGMYQMPRAQRRSRIDQLVQELQLEPCWNKRVETLSFGNRQRLALAKTLLHDPPVLMLDEPAAGLDPQARYRLRLLLQKLGREGKTILLSSHILSDLAEICNKIGMIDGGKLLRFGPVADFQRSDGNQPRQLFLELSGDPQLAQALLEQWTYTTALEKNGNRWRLTTWAGPEEQCGLVVHLVQNGIIPTHLSEQLQSLDSAFAQAIEQPCAEA